VLFLLAIAAACVGIWLVLRRQVTMCESVVVLIIALALTVAIVLGLENRGRDGGEG